MSAVVPSPRSSGEGGLSGAAARPHPRRLATYQTLLAEPGRAWTVTELAAAAGVPTGSARETLYLLVAGRAAQHLPGQRVMTFILTADGPPRLAALLTQWGRGPSPEEVLR